LRVRERERERQTGQIDRQTESISFFVILCHSVSLPLSVSVCLSGCMYGWADGRIDGWLDGLDEWVHGWKDFPRITPYNPVLYRISFCLATLCHKNRSLASPKFNPGRTHPVLVFIRSKVRTHYNVTLAPKMLILDDRAKKQGLIGL